MTKVCPVGHSGNSNVASKGCEIPLPDKIRLKDVVKHMKHVQRDSPEYLKTLHNNFVNYFSNKTDLKDTDVLAKWYSAYTHYFQSEKDSTMRAKKVGLKGTPNNFSMKDGKYFVDDKELSEEDVHNMFPGIKIPATDNGEEHKPSYTTIKNISSDLRVNVNGKNYTTEEFQRIQKRI